MASYGDYGCREKNEWRGPKLFLGAMVPAREKETHAPKFSDGGGISPSMPLFRRREDDDASPPVCVWLDLRLFLLLYSSLWWWWCLFVGL